MKICTKCKVNLPFDAYNKAKARKDGLQTICRECWKVYYKENYYNSGKEKARLLEKGKKNRLANQELIRKAKDTPCADCGIKYPPYVMQFDHLGVEEKLFNISQAISQHSATKIREEIAKCEVVCANCHAERTHQRRS